MKNILLSFVITLAFSSCIRKSTDCLLYGTNEDEEKILLHEIKGLDYNSKKDREFVDLLEKSGYECD